MGCRKSGTDGRTAGTKVDSVKSVPHRLGAEVDVTGRPQLLSDTACSRRSGCCGQAGDVPVFSGSCLPWPT